VEIFPISLKLQQQRCLIVGGGHIAYRKANLLVKAGAIVDVIAPDIISELHQLVEQSTGQYIQASFSETILATVYRLVIAATDQPDVNKSVFEQCEQRNLLVNSVDDIPHCRFMVPAIIDRSPLVISVASNGASPVLSRQLRTQIETIVPHGMGKLAEFSGQWRKQVKAKIANPDERRIFWENLYASPLKEQVFNDNIDVANDLIEQALTEWTAPKGEVYLVGAGPGDPELLTLKALRLMQQADVVIYDRLVSAPILELLHQT